MRKLFLSLLLLTGACFGQVQFDRIQTKGISTPANTLGTLSFTNPFVNFAVTDASPTSTNGAANFNSTVLPYLKCSITVTGSGAPMCSYNVVLGNSATASNTQRASDLIAVGGQATLLLGDTHSGVF